MYVDFLDPTWLCCPSIVRALSYSCIISQVVFEILLQQSTTGVHKFYQKCWRHLTFLGVRSVTWNRLCAEEPQTVGTTIKRIRSLQGHLALGTYSPMGKNSHRTQATRHFCRLIQTENRNLVLEEMDYTDDLLWWTHNKAASSPLIWLTSTDWAIMKVLTT